MIFELKKQISVQWLTKHFNLSRSGFYKWMKAHRLASHLTPKAGFRLAFIRATTFENGVESE